MKAIFRCCTLALIMCGVSAAGMAQEIIVAQSFNSLTVQEPASITGWDLSYCYGTNNAPAGDSSNHALWIQTSGSYSGDFGYATTPIYDYSGDAILSFSHAYTGDTSSKVTVSIQGGGHFEGNIDSKTYDVTVKNRSSSSSFTKEVIRIIGFTNSTTITFTLASKNSYIVIDDVNIVSTEPLVLDEETNNSSKLSTYNGKTVHVTTRQFIGGIWNTMCLPFDVNMAAMEAALGDNQDIKLRKYSSYDATNKVMNFTQVTGSTVISAGTPFLVWLKTTVNNPKFEMVTINNTAAKKVKYNNVSFVGTYNPVNLNTDGTNLFLTKSNTLAIPGAGTNQIKGMRAYISVPESMKFTANSARIAFIDEQPTAIETVESVGQQPVPATYSLSGQRVAQPKKGLYIVNGKLTLIK